MTTERAARPTAADLQRLCHRVRAAGAPGARARPLLVAEYHDLAARLGTTPVPVANGRDLAAAAAELLRGTSAAARGESLPGDRGGSQAA